MLPEARFINIRKITSFHVIVPLHNSSASVLCISLILIQVLINGLEHAVCSMLPIKVDSC
jgi:hypothetical protein